MGPAVAGRCELGGVQGCRLLEACRLWVGTESDALMPGQRHRTARQACWELTVQLCLWYIQLLVVHLIAEAKVLQGLNDVVHICKAASSTLDVDTKQHDLQGERRASHRACQLAANRLDRCSPSLAPYVSRPEAT